MSRSSFFGEGTVSNPKIKLLVTGKPGEGTPMFSSFKFSNNSLHCSHCPQSFSSLRSATEHWTEEVKSGLESREVTETGEGGSVDFETIDLLPQELETVGENVLRSDEDEVTELVDELEEHYDFLPSTERDSDEKVESMVQEAALDKTKLVTTHFKKEDSDPRDSVSCDLEESMIEEDQSEEEAGDHEPKPVMIFFKNNEESESEGDASDHEETDRLEELQVPELDFPQTMEVCQAQQLKEENSSDITPSTSGFGTNMEEELLEEKTEIEAVEGKIKIEDLDIVNDEEHLGLQTSRQDEMGDIKRKGLGHIKREKGDIKMEVFTACESVVSAADRRRERRRECQRQRRLKRSEEAVAADRERERDRKARSRDSVGPVSCDQCGGSYKNLDSLRRHKRDHHGNGASIGPVTCDLCGGTYKNLPTLKRHKNYQHGSAASIGPVTCDQCGGTFKNLPSLKSHKRAKHGKIKYSIPNNFHCELCDYSGNSRKNLDSHKAIMHNTGQPLEKFYCDQCDFSSVYRTSVKTHIKYQHEMPDQKRKQIFKKRFCDYCDFSAISPKLLRNHIETKHLGIKHECDQCSFQSESAQVLKWHIVAKHGEGFPCPHCSYRATAPTSLKLHVQAKHENVKFPCDQCSFVASFKTNLTAHVKKMHTLS